MSNPQTCMAEKVQVVEIDGPWVWVEAQPKSACGGCSAHKVCGNGAMASLLSQNNKLRMKIKNDFGASLREWIVVGWTGGSFLKTVAQTYLLPSILCVLFACIGGLYSEPVSAMGALSGLGLGMLFNALKPKQGGEYSIVFLHRVEESHYE